MIAFKCLVTKQVLRLLGIVPLIPLRRRQVLAILDNCSARHFFAAVSGDLVEVKDLTDALTPKRLQANIKGRRLCFKINCFSLPISGEDMLESVYLGDRLRIGQNVNGGGALVVQVRMEEHPSLSIDM